MSAVGRPALLLVALLFAPVLLLQVLLVPPAYAQQDDGDIPPVALRLLAVDGVVESTGEARPEGTLDVDRPDDLEDEAHVATTLQLRAGDRARSDLRLVTTVHARVTTREELRLAGIGTLPSVYSSTSTALEDMPAGTSRVVTTFTPTSELSLVGPDRAGVYPLQLQVFEGPEPVGDLVTSLVVLPEDRPDPMPLSTLVRVQADTRPRLADELPDSLARLIGPDGGLTRLAREIDRTVQDGSAAGVDLALSGRMLDDVAGVADGYTRADGSTVDATARTARRAQAALDALGGLARRSDTETLADPYGPADLVALVRGGRAAQALDLLQVGGRTVATRTGADVTTGILVPPDGIDTQTLAALGPATADAMVLGERYLAFAEADSLEPVRRLLTAGGGEVRVLVPDGRLADLATDPDGMGTAWVVQQLLADTAVRWITEDATPRSAAVLLELDALADGPEGLLGRATAALAQAPWLRPMSLSAMRLEVAPSTRLARLAYPPRSAARELPVAYVQQLGAAHDALGPLSVMLSEEDDTVARFGQSLLAAASTAYRDPDEQAGGLVRIQQVLARLEGLVDGVDILPSAPVTLTATTGEVPVTVVNSSDADLTLRATVEAARFAFAEGSTQTFTLPARSSTRLTFATEALNPGGFAPIAVTIDDPEGGVTLATTQVSVRSTAFPVVGLVAAVGSLIVLVVWGLRHGRRRRPDTVAGGARVDEVA